MRKTLLITLIFSGIVKLACSQDFPYGKVSSEELSMKKYANDTSAHAVVLQEYGSSRINVAGNDNIKLFYEYHVKIKIFDNKGFDEATAEIKLRNNDDHTEKDELESISGTTYLQDDNGSIKKVEFDATKVYTTKDYEQQSTLKFTLPALANGCIIEYTYKLTTPFYLYHFRPWNFQTDIPKIYSEYEAFIPGHFTYNAVLHGFLKLTKNKMDVEPACFSTHGAKSDCSDIKYGISNVPAFIEEDYMTAAKNYISSISFDLVEYTNPYDGAKVKATKEWKDIDYSLKTDDDFGIQLKKKDVFKDRMVPVIAGKTEDLEKAKAIYAYIQKWFKWNNYIGFGTYTGVKKAYETHSGSVGDINIALIDALNSAGINTEAVLLSTRDNGIINEIYPAVNDFNYVVAKANIGDKSYLLDATDQLLPFGMLPLKCLNSKGRAFSLGKPSYWIDLNLPQKETSTVTMDLTLQADGKLKGKITDYSIGYEAYKKRLEIKKFNTVDEYVEDVNSRLPKLKILSSDITNVDSVDKPVSEIYEVEINVYDKANTGNLSFNPFFLDKISNNPFKLDDRLYPIDMGMPGDYRTTLILNLPANYTVDSPPQNTAISLPNNGGRFLTDYQAGDSSFTFAHIMQFNKSIYGSEEYPYLKEFYNKIIQSEKAEMIFKKKQ